MSAGSGPPTGQHGVPDVLIGGYPRVGSGELRSGRLLGL